MVENILEADSFFFCNWSEVFLQLVEMILQLSIIFKQL